MAFNAAVGDAREHGSLEVPLRLRNAPTRLMRDLGHGAGYRYAHDEVMRTMKRMHLQRGKVTSPKT
jgi:putative ATPase